MASFRKRGKTWYAEVNKRGIRKSATFSTKAEAQAWAATAEAEIIAGKRGAVHGKTFADLLEKYSDDVSVNKRGARWEQMRLAATGRLAIGKIPLTELNATHIASWRDSRLKSVASATVRREWNLLSAACSIAVKEWHWLPENPFKELPRPQSSHARERIYTENEIERVLFALGYDYEKPPETLTARCGAAFLFALETAMRAGEIVGLTWDRVNLETQVARLEETKNGYSRSVPLSQEAVRILRQLPKADPVFGLSNTQLYFLFRNGRETAGVDATFHDSRATAITRLAKKLDILDLARMSGHRNLSMLQVYYRETAEEIAKRLD
jgi:integrase